MTTTYRSHTTRYSSMYSKMYRTGKRLSLSPIGDMRRVQALRRIGYTSSSIAAGTGLSADHLAKIAQGYQVRIGLDAHRRIGIFYAEHSWHPRFDTQGKKATVWAKKYGWAPPGAWDDIDDPNDKPKGVLL